MISAPADSFGNWQAFFCNFLLHYSTRRGIMSTAYVIGGKIMLHIHAAQFFYSYYYFFASKR